MALAVVLLIGAALLIRSFIALRQVNPGFDARNILTMRTSLVGPQFATAASVTRAIDEGMRRIRALPGVEMAASTCCVPLEDRLHGTFQIVGRGEGPDSHVLTGWAVISPGYFETFKIPVLRGRAFTQRDESGPAVVVINRTLAKKFWPNGDPLKDRIVFTGGGSARQIVGVVEDVREDTLSRAPRPNVYLLANQMTGTELLQTLPWVWAIRTRGAPMPLSAAIQNELREATGALPVASVRTMDEILARSTGAERFRTFALTIFGCAALLLAGVGIYGSMAYSVAQHRQEIGIRLALGADSSHVRNMVALQGARPALVGAVCGIGAALGLARLIAGLLFDVEPLDPLVFIAAPAISMVVALAAVWLPAERASRADPIAALRRQ
jgi:predicted permease